METGILVPVILFIIFSVGVPGNAIVLYVLVQQRRTWTVSTHYLINLVIADLLFVLTTPLWGHYYLNKFDWVFGAGLCKLSAAITSINMYGSVFFLTAMAVDRWMAVVHAIDWAHYRKHQWARWACFAIWCAAVVLSIPRFLYQILRAVPVRAPTFNTKYSTPLLLPNGSSIDATSFGVNPTQKQDDESVIRTYCTFYIPSGESKALKAGFIELLHALIGFIIPMVIICFCYARILITVKSKLISKNVKKDRISKLAALIIMAFFICWLPSQVMKIYSALGGWWRAFSFDKTTYHIVYPYTLCLAWINSCINPLIYVLTTKTFHDFVNKHCCTGCNKSARKYVLRWTRVGRQETINSEEGGNDQQGTHLVEIHTKEEVSKNVSDERFEKKKRDESTSRL
ncbi:unnamed protein product [Clavelina lepadiformis]|uniref:G-protein coupled receptors family 1 profile domain-containing protein n=1 Tax=Clavelina lepadiformis TaxID=159417 RepID=A0ABP0FNE6_CLALP